MNDGIPTITSHGVYLIHGGEDKGLFGLSLSGANVTVIQTIDSDFAIRLADTLLEVTGERRRREER